MDSRNTEGIAGRISNACHPSALSIYRPNRSRPRCKRHCQQQGTTKRDAQSVKTAASTATSLSPSTPKWHRHVAARCVVFLPVDPIATLAVQPPFCAVASRISEGARNSSVQQCFAKNDDVTARNAPPPITATCLLFFTFSPSSFFLPSLYHHSVCSADVVPVPIWRCPGFDPARRGPRQCTHHTAFITHRRCCPATERPTAPTRTANVLRSPKERAPYQRAPTKPTQRTDYFERACIVFCRTTFCGMAIAHKGDLLRLLV